MATQRIRTGDIQVEGLKELSRELRSLGPELVKEMRGVNKDVAEMVADDARTAALTIGGVAAKVAPSVRASAGVKSAGVTLGGPGYEMAAGAEFGAAQNVPRQRRTGTYRGFNQFRPWRGSGRRAGYFVYPTIRRDAGRIVDRYEQGTDRVIKRAGLG